VSVEQIKEVLKSDSQIQSLARELYQQKSVLVMGRGYNYATCLEGALVSTYTVTFLLNIFWCFFLLWQVKMQCYIWSHRAFC